MPPYVPAKINRRVAVRAVAVATAIGFIVTNLASGLARGQQAHTVPASDDAIEAFLIDQVREAGYPGAAFAIVRDGRITASGGIGRVDDAGRPVRSETPFVLGSLSKAFTATAVMQLVEAGSISLDAPVSRYLPDFALADGRQSEITVRHADRSPGLPHGQRPARSSGCVLRPVGATSPRGRRVPWIHVPNQRLLVGHRDRRGSVSSALDGAPAEPRDA